MVLRTITAAAGPSKEKENKIVHVLTLVVVKLQVGVGIIGKYGEKNQVYIDCSIPGGCFFGCVVAT